MVNTRLRVGGWVRHLPLTPLQSNGQDRKSGKSQITCTKTDTMIMAGSHEGTEQG